MSGTAATSFEDGDLKHIAVTPYDPLADVVIQALMAEAEADADVIGFILLGSRGLGVATIESDYDAVFFVTDAANARYAQTQHTPQRGATLTPPIATRDIWHESPNTLRREKIVDWMWPMWAESRILFDRTGETERAVAPMRRIPTEEAARMTAAHYGAYLNSLYRSLKSWRRGEVLGARMEAAQSADYVLHTLFALECRWRPYNSRLWYHLDALVGQGWEAAELQEALLDLITTGNPRRQQWLAQRMTALLRERGFGGEYDEWEGQIDRALAWTF
jgi:hypothetical protein